MKLSTVLHQYCDLCLCNDIRIHHQKKSAVTHHSNFGTSIDVIVLHQVKRFIPKLMNQTMITTRNIYILSVTQNACQYVR